MPFYMRKRTQKIHKNVYKIKKIGKHDSSNIGDEEVR